MPLRQQPCQSPALPGQPRQFQHRLNTQPEYNWLFYAFSASISKHLCKCYTPIAGYWFPLSLQTNQKYLTSVHLCPQLLNIFPSFLHFNSNFSACWNELEYEQQEAKTVGLLPHIEIQPVLRHLRDTPWAHGTYSGSGNVPRRNTQWKHKWWRLVNIVKITFSKYSSNHCKKKLKAKMPSFHSDADTITYIHKNNPDSHRAASSPRMETLCVRTAATKTG